MEPRIATMRELHENMSVCVSCLAGCIADTHDHYGALGDVAIELDMYSNMLDIPAEMNPEFEQLTREVMNIRKMQEDVDDRIAQVMDRLTAMLPNGEHGLRICPRCDAPVYVNVNAKTWPCYHCGVSIDMGDWSE